MKTGKKIAVLALIFVAAAIIYFVWPLGRKEENKTGVVYTAMGEAELPVVYPTALGPGAGAVIRPSGGAGCHSRT